MSRIRILFIGEAVALAHVARPLALARTLDARRFEVSFAADRRAHELISDDALPLFHLPSIPPSVFLRRADRGDPVFEREDLLTYVERDLDLLGRVAPDLVVGDFRLSLSISAALAGLPLVGVTNAHWSPYFRGPYPIPDHRISRTLGPWLGQWVFDRIRPGIFARHFDIYNGVRRHFGLPDLAGDLRTAYCPGDHVVYADHPSFQPMAPLPPHHRFLGPVFWSSPCALPSWWNDLPSGRPLIYANPGSTGSSKFLPTLFRAVDGLSVTVMAATAGGPRGDAPSNVFLADYLPGAACADRAEVVISNGGMSAWEALARGRPVLGIAANIDQHLSMAAVERGGGGIRLRSERLTVKGLRAALRRLLEDPAYRTAARGAADALRGYNAEERFPAMISAIAEGRPGTPEADPEAGKDRVAGDARA